MLFNEDKKIKIEVSFLQDKTVLYVDSRIGSSHLYIEEVWEDLLDRFRDIGYRFLFLPDLADYLVPSLVEYMFPGQQGTLFVEDMYQRIQDLAGLDDKTGFLYKQDGTTYFRVLPEYPYESIETEIDDLIDFLSGTSEPETSGIRFSKKVLSEPCYDFSKEVYYAPPGPGAIEDTHPGLCESTEDIRFRYSIESDEEPLDTRTQKIIHAWEKIEKEFGITIEDLDIILGYRVKLSRLNITTSGKVILTDWSNGTEVKMDDLTKALYFFYLRHPEGVALKEVQTHEQEFMRYYSAITGRDDPRTIQKSVDNFLNPFGNNLNVSISRIKKAFKDIVGERIARFYYVDGRYAEPRKVAIDRDLVIWDY